MPVLGFRRSNYRPFDEAPITVSNAVFGLADESLGIDRYTGSRRSPVAPLAPAAQKSACANPHCTSAWIAPWKSRRRSVFEGGWACSAQCLSDLVRQAVRREMGDTHAVPPAAHRHRVPLGLVLLAQGWITHPQLCQALDAQREEGSRRIGDWLVESCGVDMNHVTRALAMQWNCPVYSVAGFLPHQMSLVMPHALIDRHGILPIRETASGGLHLASSRNPDAALSYALARMHRIATESGLTEAADWDSARASLLATPAVECETDHYRTSEDLCERVLSTIQTHQPVASRLIRVHDSFWLRCWLEDGSMTMGLPHSGEDLRDLLLSRGSNA